MHYLGVFDAAVDPMEKRFLCERVQEVVVKQVCCHAVRYDLVVDLGNCCCKGNHPEVRWIISGISFVDQRHLGCSP